VIILRAKHIEFDVTYINLRDKPDWFLKISPHGKVPVLVVEDRPLFESNAIAEFLDETVAPRLHPSDPFKRARNRAWTDFVPDFSKAVSKFTYGKSQEDIDEGLEIAPKRFERLEEALENEREGEGPYFNDDQLCLVDAAYAPFLMRFSLAEEVLQTGVMNNFPLLKAWSDALHENPHVTQSLSPEFDGQFKANLKRRETLLWTMMLDRRMVSN